MLKNFQQHVLNPPIDVVICVINITLRSTPGSPNLRGHFHTLYQDLSSYGTLTLSLFYVYISTLLKIH
jgi:hypothetical protein